MESLKKFWFGIKDVGGRTNRKDFWIGNLGNAIILYSIYYGLAYLIDYICWYLYVDLYTTDWIVSILFYAFLIPYFVAAVSSCLRRLRDAGFSSWWILGSLVPVMWIVIFIFYCMKSKAPVSAEDSVTS